MANGWPSGKFGDEFGQGARTYAGTARAQYMNYGDGALN